MQPFLMVECWRDLPPKAVIPGAHRLWLTLGGKPTSAEAMVRGEVAP